jgi:hypothetical protein
MQAAVKAGVVLGLLVVAWTFVMGFTGWYKHPTLLNLFWVVIPIQVGVLFWELRKIAGEGRAYGGQIVAGMLSSLIGSVLIFAGSILFTTVAFPRYFEELQTMGRELLRSQGKSEAEIASQMTAAVSMQTPVTQATIGAVGTNLTGLLTSLAVGAVYRRKG